MAPPLGPRCTGRPAGLSMTSISPSRWSTRAWISLRGQFERCPGTSIVVMTFAHGAKPLTRPQHERYHSRNAQTELVAAAFERPGANLEFARDGRCRSRHQAQAHRAMLDDIEECCCAPISAPTWRPDRGRGGRRPLRQGDLGGRREVGGRDRGRKGAGAGRKAAGDRRAAKAVRHPGGRRQRLRQDHHHRQTRGKTERRGPKGDAGGRRYVSRRRHRAVEGLGRADQIAGDRGRAGFGFGKPCLQCADRGEEKLDMLLVDTAGDCGTRPN